jgi:hypothetical protein
MTNALRPHDVRDLLTGFSAAIELDQFRVDAIPHQKSILRTMIECGVSGVRPIFTISVRFYRRWMGSPRRC